MRFSRYNDLWIKTTLNTDVERITRRNTNNESNLPLTISAQYGLINQNEFFNKQIASRDLTNYILLNKGEFAYNKSYSADYPWGAVKRLDKYDKGVLSSLYICFAPKSNVDSDFLVHYFETPKWYNEISNIAGEGARNHGLLNMAVSDYFNTKHSFPSIQEQHKISQFLNLINQRIDTQSKIIEKYESLIKAISNKLFFNITNRVNLSEICSITTGKLDVNQMDENGIYPFFTCGKETLKINKYAFDCEAILISGNGDIGRTKYYNGKFNAYQRTYILYNFKGSPIFVKYAIDYALPKKVKEETQISAMPYIKLGTLSELSIPYPDIHIQIEDVQILNTLQTKINVETEILEKLKEQKKYLLSNMFI